MTAKELIEFELAQVGKQIDACLDGMSEQGMDTRCAVCGMAPRDILEHLGEAYMAFIAHARGEKYEWGSYKVDDKSTANLRSTIGKLRAEAVTVALAGDEDKTLRDAYEYIVGHDNYHVGQLVLSRIQVEPEWDSYAIYA